jgi:hypothetical protein
MTATESCWTLHGVRIIFIVQAESVMFTGLFSFVFQMNFYFLEKHLQEASMSKCKPIFIATTLAYWLLSGTIVLYGQQAKPETSIENIFQMGLMAQDTNGDQIADAICGHVIVPKSPSAAENTAAANFAARLGYETSALTLPIVVAATGQMARVVLRKRPIYGSGGRRFLPEPLRSPTMRSRSSRLAKVAYSV